MEPIVGNQRSTWLTTARRCVTSVNAWLSDKWNEKLRLTQELDRRAGELATASSALVTLEKANDALKSGHERLAANMQALEAKGSSLEEVAAALKRRNAELESQLNAAMSTGKYGVLAV